MVVPGLCFWYYLIDTVIGKVSGAFWAKARGAVAGETDDYHISLYDCEKRGKKAEAVP